MLVLRGFPMSTAALVTIAIVLTVAVPVLLLAVAGGPNVIFAEHDLPRPTRYSRRAPKEADR
ncbi:hypothetical protein NOSIN_00355 [Nocardiopsis sinuspersici]|uniref:Uncharacterized protein n=2 Tax=Nocardiopsidaceae TaxID=83676 RepID=A0A1V3BUY3_9ACTN|nr:hypothetical protein NOSIN_00355 [Nocardiopsis sinuspersici]